MNKYPVDTDIPLPQEGRGSISVYPFRFLQIGDSFAAPLSKYRALSAGCVYHGRKHGYKFTMRRNMDEQTVRVRRIQ